MRVTETFHVLAGAGDPIKAADLREDALEWILGVAAPRYDFVIFDLGVSLNAVSMVALDRSDRVEVVLQPSMPHVRAARRLQELLVSLGCPLDRLQLVLNRQTRASDRARAALEEVLSMHAAHVIADDPATVGEAVDQGVPLSRLSRNCGVARSLQAFAKQLVDGETRPRRDSERDAPLLARLFSRGAAPKLKSM